jgi:hypothetical protein
MTTKQKAEFLKNEDGWLTGTFCPHCDGDMFEFEPYRNRALKNPLICIDCGKRMGHDAPVAWPGTTITAVDYERAIWQHQQDNRVVLLGDVVDQVLDRLGVT